MKRLWVARHAPVVARGVCYGRSDVPVAEPFARSARALARALPIARPCAVWSSRSPRCAGVAREMARLWSVEARCCDLFAEMDLGRWEGRRWEEIQRDDAEAYDLWMTNWRTMSPHGGETPGDLVARTRRALRAIRAASGSEHVLIAHAGVLRALRVILEGLDWGAAMSLDFPFVCWGEPMVID